MNNNFNKIKIEIGSDIINEVKYALDGHCVVLIERLLENYNHIKINDHNDIKKQFENEQDPEIKEDLSIILRLQRMSEKIEFILDDMNK